MTFVNIKYCCDLLIITALLIVLCNAGRLRPTSLDKLNSEDSNNNILGSNVDKYCKGIAREAAEKACAERKFRQSDKIDGNKEDAGLKMIALLDANDISFSKCKQMFKNRVEGTDRLALELQAKMFVEKAAEEYCERAS
eukprot:g454.t1